MTCTRGASARLPWCAGQPLHRLPGRLDACAGRMCWTHVGVCALSACARKPACPSNSPACRRPGHRWPRPPSLPACQTTHGLHLPWPPRYTLQDKYAAALGAAPEAATAQRAVYHCNSAAALLKLERWSDAVQVRGRAYVVGGRRRAARRRPCRVCARPPRFAGRPARLRPRRLRALHVAAAAAVYLRTARRVALQPGPAMACARRRVAGVHRCAGA